MMKMAKPSESKFRLLTDSVKSENHSTTTTGKGALLSVENDLMIVDVKDMESVERNGRGALHLAAIAGQLKTMEYLVSHGADVNLKDSSGDTPLHLAVEANQTGSVRFLLSRGADPSLLNDRSIGAIHVAVKLDRRDALAELLKSGRVDPNLGGEDGATPLHYCAWFDRPECARTLLANKASISRQCDIGLYPLHVAVQNGSTATRQVLVEFAEKNGMPVKEYLEKIDKERSTPLHTAVVGGDLKAVKTFLSYGSSITTTLEDGSTSVHLAAAQGSTAMIQLMFDMQPEAKVTCLRSGDALGMTPLHRAALMNRSQTVEYLLGQEGSEIDARTGDGQTPLLLAASRRAWATAKALIAAGADVALKDPDNRNIAHLTIRGGGRLEKLEICLCKESMRRLLDDQDRFGCTPLHYACSQGHLKTVAKLLLLGSNPCTKTDQKQSALHFAARIGHYETCKLLIEYTPCGNNVINEIDGEGQTPLHGAAEQGHVKVVKLLLRRCAAAVKDFNGNTPLHLAAKGGYVDTLAAILDVHVALLDNLNKNHDSCLHLTAREGHPDAVTLLLTKGCKLNLNKDDLSAMDLAIKNGHQEACVALVSHERWREVMDNRSTLYGCPMVGLIKHMPEVSKIILDRSCRPSGPDSKAPDFHYIYDFKYLQMKYDTLWTLKKHGFSALPMFAMNMMVKFNRLECLVHPVCRKFLAMKWEAYGRCCHLTNLLVYLVFLVSLTGFILSRQHCRALERKAFRPPLHYNVTDDDGNSACNTYLRYPSTLSSVLLVLIAVSISINVIKIIVQLIKEGLSYFADITNALECLLFTSSGIFAGSFLVQVEFYYRWTYGTVAIFMAWFNLLLFLQRFDYFGIHIVMFLEILKTLVKVITVFFVLFIAFGIVFTILQTDGHSVSFAGPGLSLMSTVVMMLGAVDYVETWANPFNGGELAHPILNFLMLLVFILFMPILLVNLLIGLAVGDIDSVRKNACLKRMAMQVQLYTELEEKLPKRLLLFVDKPFVKVYPGSSSDTLYNRMMKRFTKKDIITDTGTETDAEKAPGSDISICKELLMARMKQMAGVLEKQQCMLHRIARKLEICEEEEEDDEEDCDDEEENVCEVNKTELSDEDNKEESSLFSQLPPAVGWSSRALRHTLLKQAGVIAKWKQKEHE